MTNISSYEGFLEYLTTQGILSKNNQRQMLNQFPEKDNEILSLLVEAGLIQEDIMIQHLEKYTGIRRFVLDDWLNLA